VRAGRFVTRPPAATYGSNCEGDKTKWSPEA
jgi:hypothetical protein